MFIYLRFSICFSQLLIQPILKTDDEVASNLGGTAFRQSCRRNIAIIVFLVAENI